MCKTIRQVQNSSNRDQNTSNLSIIEANQTTHAERRPPARTLDEGRVEAREVDERVRREEEISEQR